MKKFLKMAALMLLAGALVIGFASCSNDSSDSSTPAASTATTDASGSSTTTTTTTTTTTNTAAPATVNGVAMGTCVATYNRTDKDYKVYLYDSGKAALYDADVQKVLPASNGIRKTGTFTKTNTYKDGTIKITWTQYLDTDKTWKDFSEEKENTFVNGVTGSGKWKLSE